MAEGSWVYFALFILLTVSFSLSNIFQRIILSYSNKYELLDKIKERKIKKTPVPRLGGVGVFLSISLTLTVFLLLMRLIPDLRNEKILSELISDLTSPVIIIFSVLFIFLIGIIDDLYEISFILKLSAELIIASLLYFSGIQIKFVSLPFGGEFVSVGIFSFLVTVLWIVGVTNSINLIDGVDGLAGGIISISSFFMIVIFLIRGDFLFAVLLMPLLGAVAGFLPFNRYPSKMLLGDSGSLLSGMLLSIFVLRTSTKAAFGIILLVPLALLAIPILDTILAFTRRILKGQSPFRADGDHIHHRLIKKGLSERKTTSILCATTFILSLLGLASVLISKQLRIFLWGVFFIFIIAIVSYLNYIRFDWIKKIFNDKIR